jgi:hypothetical protein
MSVRMKGLVLQQISHNGKVSEKGIYGDYDGQEAQVVALNNGNLQMASLDNQDITQLLSMPSSRHSLVERLERDLGRGHHHHRRRHHSHHRRRHHEHHTHRRHKAHKRRHRHKTHKRRHRHKTHKHRHRRHRRHRRHTRHKRRSHRTRRR